MHGDYWIDYRRSDNPLAGVTRRWMETEKDFRDDLRELNTYPYEVMAFGYKVEPPALGTYMPVMLLPL
jgi:hypothetical protein